MLLYGNVNATRNIMVCRKSSTVKTPVMAPKEQEMKQLNGKVSHCLYTIHLALSIIENIIYTSCYKSPNKQVDCFLLNLVCLPFYSVLLPARLNGAYLIVSDKDFFPKTLGQWYRIGFTLSISVKSASKFQSGNVVSMSHWNHSYNCRVFIA